MWRYLLIGDQAGIPQYWDPRRRVQPTAGGGPLGERWRVGGPGHVAEQFLETCNDGAGGVQAAVILDVGRGMVKT